MATPRSARVCAHLRTVVAAFLLAVLAGAQLTSAQYDAKLRARNTPKNSKSSKTSKSSQGTTYCYDLTAYKQPGGGCANFDLRKIEFDVSMDCRGSVASMTFNGQKLGVSWQSFPGRGLVLKFVRPNGEKNPLATHASLVGKKVPVCFTLYPGKCGTLSRWCRNGGTCDIAYFSPNMKCVSVNGY